MKQNGVKVACEPLEEQRKLSRTKRASALTALSAGLFDPEFRWYRGNNSVLISRDGIFFIADFIMRTNLSKQVSVFMHNRARSNKAWCNTLKKQTL